MTTTMRIAAAAMLMALAGCSTTALGSRSTGTVVGGFAGNDRQQRDPISSTLTGGMNGGLIAGEIGAGIGDKDKRTGLATEYQALEYGQGGQEFTWNGSGTSGEVVAGQPYRVGSQDCRQYRHTVRVGEESRSDSGTACRNADGSWTPLT
ncbi:MAG: hypothetical protein M9905_03325 [Rhizobiaceae bacterium]|nr:hypothetical protein [Rhizobiaceae bacterium]